MGTWSCIACSSENEAYMELCTACGCSRSPTETELESRVVALRAKRERREALEKGRAALLEFVRALILAPASFWIAWTFFSEEKATISFSRRSETVFEVVGPFSSLLAALGMLVAGSLWLSVALDHLDDRNNEHKYQRFAKNASNLFVLCMVFALWVGWRFEFIRQIPR